MFVTLDAKISQFWLFHLTSHSSLFFVSFGFIIMSSSHSSAAVSSNSSSSAASMTSSSSSSSASSAASSDAKQEKKKADSEEAKQEEEKKAGSEDETKSLDEKLEKLRSDNILPSNLQQGLSDEEVSNRKQRFGPNEIPEKHRPLILQFLDHFIGKIPFLIEGCFIFSLGLSNWIDAGIIVSLLVLNAVIGFIQQYQVELLFCALPLC